jgi:hypothetical protein
MYFLSAGLNKLDVRSRGLGCADATLQAEHRRISETWVGKALPGS